MTNRKAFHLPGPWSGVPETKMVTSRAQEYRQLCSLLGVSCANDANRIDRIPGAHTSDTVLTPKPRLYLLSLNSSITRIKLSSWQFQEMGFFLTHKRKQDTKGECRWQESQTQR